MTIEIVLVALAGVIVGAVAVWLFAAGKSQQLKSELAASKASREHLEQHGRQLSHELEKQQQEYKDLHRQLLESRQEVVQIRTEKEERDTAYKNQQHQWEQQKKQLTEQFENLANRIFEEKGRAFTQTSQQSLEHMLKPFREQIEGFQKRVNEVHSETLKGNTSLESEIKKVLDVGLKMHDEANNLTKALKGDSQKRGAWGEAQLERTLQMSGLVEDAHYEKQTSFKDADGRSRQTDYIIKLPDNKHIIIDSKVTLNAYDQLIAAETEEQQQAALDEHVQAVKRHIDDLSSKDYSNLIGMRSPSFVLMFMPIEPAYIEALKHHKDLFDYGYKKNIILVSHTTLVPILRTVANLWMLDQSNKEAREISEKAGDIFNQVCLVAERLQKLGGTLGTVSNHYNNTVKALVGQQGLYGKVDRFTQLSSKVTKSLPDLEPLHTDYETERLHIIQAEDEDETTDDKSDV